jgi:hypothetical protein
MVVARRAWRKYSVFVSSRARVLVALAVGSSACALSTVGLLVEPGPAADAGADTTTPAAETGNGPGGGDAALDGAAGDGADVDAALDASLDAADAADAPRDGRACDASTLLEAGRLGSPALGGAVTVNGDLSEWGCVPFVVMDRVTSGHAAPADASIRAEFATQWSASAVYFAFRVFDNAAPSGADNVDPHNNDSVEVYLDGDGFLMGNYDAGDHQYVVDHLAQYKDYGPEPPVVPPGGQFARAVVKNGNDYTVEMSVSAAALGRASFASGNILGFDVQINNHVGTTPHAETLIWRVNPQPCSCGAPCCCGQGGDLPWCNTQRFGFLHLLP